MFIVAEIQVTGKGQKIQARIELPKNAKKIVGVKVESNVVSNTFPSAPAYNPPMLIPQAQLVNIVNLEQVNWTNVIGNKDVKTYYTGIVPGNPSGNKNIRDITFFKNGVPIFKKVFSYDANDDNIAVECLAP